MDDPGAFFDPFAELYDARAVAREDSPMAGDIDFYRDLAREVEGPALEVGVGTGRIYLDLVASGLDVDGIDLSERSLDRLRTKAAERGLEPSVWLADVTSMRPDRTYGLIYAPARAMNHLHTLADQRAALEQIRSALADGGRFACNTFVPQFDVIESYGEPKEERLTVDGTAYRIVSTTEFADEVEQVTRYRREIYRDGELIADRETPLALIPKRQFELLFEVTGFSDWTVYGGFDRDPLEDASQEMVWVVER